MEANLAFLQSISDKPDDDAPRLIYADWLEEHGRTDAEKAHAQFIRAQIELARSKVDTPERRLLAFRARGLLEQHEPQGLGPLRTLAFEWKFCRGFIEKVGLVSEDPEEVRELFRLPLRRLLVTGLGSDVEWLRSIPADNCLTGLDLCGNALTADSLGELARIRHLNRLNVLSLQFNLLDDDVVRVLCEQPFFWGLSQIRCGANPLRESARQRLREQFGERVSFACERDEDHLYAFQDDWAFRAGFGNDHTQLLLLASHTAMDLAVFDHEGNLLALKQKPIAQRGPRGPEWDVRRAPAVNTWQKKLGFQSATIKVKRFRFSVREGISDFLPYALDAFSRRNDPELGHARDCIQRWVINGQFVYDFGDDNCFIGRDGEVT